MRTALARLLRGLPQTRLVTVAKSVALAIYRGLSASEMPLSPGPWLLGRNRGHGCTAALSLTASPGRYGSFHQSSTSCVLLILLSVRRLALCFRLGQSWPAPLAPQSHQIVRATRGAHAPSLHWQTPWSSSVKLSSAHIRISESCVWPANDAGPLHCKAHDGRHVRHETVSSWPSILSERR